jgi:hypothetical protein
MSEDLITIGNDGQTITNTDYWQHPYAAKGLFFLSTNAGCLRLLVPQPHVHLIPEMTNNVREVVLTRGKMEGKDDVVEIMFEDGSDAPFSLHLDPGQLDRRWTKQDEGSQCVFAVYTEGPAKVAEFTRCFLRRASRLPHMKPWKGSERHE